MPRRRGLGGPGDGIVHGLMHAAEPPGGPGRAGRLGPTGRAERVAGEAEFDLLGDSVVCHNAPSLAWGVGQIRSRLKYYFWERGVRNAERGTGNINRKWTRVLNRRKQRERSEAGTGDGAYAN